MAWVVFERAFTFTPREDRRTSTAYAAGYAVSVRLACKRAAIAARVARAYPTPKVGDHRVQTSANGTRFISPAEV